MVGWMMLFSVVDKVLVKIEGKLSVGVGILDAAVLSDSIVLLGSKVIVLDALVTLLELVLTFVASGVDWTIGLLDVGSII